MLLIAFLFVGWSDFRIVHRTASEQQRVWWGDDVVTYVLDRCVGKVAYDEIVLMILARKAHLRTFVGLYRNKSPLREKDDILYCTVIQVSSCKNRAHDVSIPCRRCTYDFSAF